MLVANYEPRTMLAISQRSLPPSTGRRRRSPPWHMYAGPIKSSACTFMRQHGEIGHVDDFLIR